MCGISWACSLQIARPQKIHVPCAGRSQCQQFIGCSSKDSRSVPARYDRPDWDTCVIALWRTLCDCQLDLCWRIVGLSVGVGSGRTTVIVYTSSQECSLTWVAVSVLLGAAPLACA